MRLRTFRRAVTLVAIASVLVGCDRSDPKSGNTVTDAWPTGVVTPGPDAAKTGIGAITGIYPIDPNQDVATAGLCCWLAKSAVFQVRVPANAKTLVLTTLLPAIKPFTNEPQSLAVRVDGSAPYRAAIDIGATIVRVPIRSEPADRVSDVVVDAAYTFVPMRFKVSRDTRELSLYLRAASAR